MKALQFLALTGIGLLTMSSSCEREDATPIVPLTTGRVVRIQITTDDQGQRPRPRWEIDVTPLSFPGLSVGSAAGEAFQHVKVFDLPDTAVYKAGRTLQFRYQLVPQAQHTPWRTAYERYNMAPGLAWGDRLPELSLTDVQVVQHP